MFICCGSTDMNGLACCSIFHPLTESSTRAFTERTEDGRLGREGGESKDKEERGKKGRGYIKKAPLVLLQRTVKTPTCHINFQLLAQVRILTASRQPLD